MLYGRDCTFDYLHLKISRAAPNQLANSTDNTIYGLTNLPTPVSLLTVGRCIENGRSSEAKCVSEQRPFSTIHTYTGKILMHESWKCLTPTCGYRLHICRILRSLMSLLHGGEQCCVLDIRCFTVILSMHRLTVYSGLIIMYTHACTHHTHKHTYTHTHAHTRTHTHARTHTHTLAWSGSS